MPRMDFIRNRFRGALVLWFGLLSLAAPLKAQFIGYTSPQTVQQTLANNVSCSGVAQDFPVSNLGQTQHQVTGIVSATSQSFTMQFMGFDNQGNSFPISDIATVVNNNPFTNGVLQAVGYFPIVKVRVICSTVGAPTFTLNYSGTSSIPIFDRSGYQVSQYDKFVFSGRSQSSAGTVALTSPTFNTNGIIFFSYIGTPSGANGSVGVLCQSSANPSAATFSFTLANISGIQSFPVPSAACPFLAITYATPGTPNGTFLLEYVFTPNGIPPITDPCASPGIAKSSAVITAPAAATTQIVAGVAGQMISVCGYNVGLVVAVAGTVQWTTGTGGACGAATVTKTGAIPVNTAEPFSYSGPGTLFTAAPGSGVCITLTGAGDNGAGILTFVQQ